MEIFGTNDLEKNQKNEKIIILLKNKESLKITTRRIDDSNEDFYDWIKC